MRRLSSILLWLTLATAMLPAQTTGEGLELFGYFQNQFKFESDPDTDRERTTFLLQQLNVFLQRGFTPHWSAFVNTEVVNSFSSSRGWGSLNLQEAWVKYRFDRRFQFRLGLQIPTFNHLNRIKNRTPLLPYVIRPLVYEASLEEVVPVDEFVPGRAFVQAYGVLGDRLKLDYAAFVGNSPNIAGRDLEGQSGIDTTTAVLLGGRAGLRIGEFKGGLSLTHDRVNGLVRGDFAIFRTRGQPELTRYRLGADLLYSAGPLTVSGEYIGAFYDEDTLRYRFDKTFLYGTLVWRIGERLQVYASYWRTVGYILDSGGLAPENLKRTVESATAGVAFPVNDRVTLKGQFVNLEREQEHSTRSAPPGFEIASLAVSVFF